MKNANQDLLILELIPRGNVTAVKGLKDLPEPVEIRALEIIDNLRLHLKRSR